MVLPITSMTQATKPQSHKAILLQWQILWSQLIQSETHRLGNYKGSKVQERT